MQRDIRREASPSAPCPVCHGESKCWITSDEAHFCRRPPAEPAEWSVLRPADDTGFAMYRRVSDTRNLNGKRHTSNSPVPSAASPPPSRREDERDWKHTAEMYAKSMRPERLQTFAASIGLPVAALSRIALLGVESVDSSGLTFTIPECDGSGKIVGLQTRTEAGEKKAVPGCKRGLTLVTDDGENWCVSLVLVVEGATDTLAATAAGLAAVGRVSNVGGIEDLAVLLADLPQDRRIVFVGENDAKPDGSWPGRDGAKKSAAKLATKLGRPVYWAMVPQPHKDTRKYLTSDDLAELDWPERGRRLEAAILENLHTCEPKTSPPAKPAAKNPPGVIGLSPYDSAGDPHRLAALFLHKHRRPSGTLLLRRWLSDWWRWECGAYRQVEDEQFRNMIQASIRDTFHDDVAGEGDGDEKKTRESTTVTAAVVTNAVHAAVEFAHIPSAQSPHVWINGVSGPSPRRLVSFPNGLYDLESDELLPLSPDFFTLNALEFPFDGEATEPVEWLKFLGSVWGDDKESIDTLQDWFGYVISADTSLQKLLFLQGPPRSGKGTILTVMERIVGCVNTVGMSLGELIAPFGLADMVGKSLAVFSDARLSGSQDRGLIIERLLSITGEDKVPVNRKFKKTESMRLPVRLVIASNEFPKLNDASNALVNRMVFLHMTKSFLGKEDDDLKGRLMAELPAIFNWSAQGWRRLQHRRRFVQPQSATEIIREAEDASSPVAAFVRECCKIGANRQVSRNELYESYQSWCKAQGNDKPVELRQFARYLRATVPSIQDIRLRDGADRTRCYRGISVIGVGEFNSYEDEKNANWNGEL
jgi:P4 family phage/plasmid primase-like protien